MTSIVIIGGVIDLKPNVSNVRKRNKISQNIKRQLSVHITDINLVIPWVGVAQSAREYAANVRTLQYSERNCRVYCFNH